MLSVLVCYEKTGWQKGIQSVLSRQSFVSASYADLRAKDRRIPGDHYDVIFVETGRDKSLLQANLTMLRRRFHRSRFVLILERLGISDLSFGYRMGISAFLDERATPDQLMSSLEAAMRGDLYVASSVARRSQTAAGAGDDQDEDWGEGYHPEDLSQRELEVLNLVARGFTNRGIARELFISEKTVKNHLYSIFRKIGVSDRTKAALYAVKGLSSHKNGSYGPAEVFFEIDEPH